jgi:hypothetical protein
MELMFFGVARQSMLPNARMTVFPLTYEKSCGGFAVMPHWKPG